MWKRGLSEVNSLTLNYLLNALDKERGTVRRFIQCGSSRKEFNCKIKHNEVSVNGSGWKIGRHYSLFSNPFAFIDNAVHWHRLPLAAGRTSLRT